MKHAEKLTPYPRQEVTIQRILDEPTRAALLADVTGAGKTLTASEIIVRSDPRRALIIGVGRTFTQWESRLHAQSDGAITLRRLGSKGDELANFEAFLNGDDGVYFSTIQWLMTRDWITVDRERKQTDVFRKMCNRKRGGIDLLVFDECFVAGTMIDTPNGPRAIESLEVGDEVYGYDHSKSEVIVTTITNRMERQSAEILPHGSTVNHPYYVVGDGYRPAGDLTEEDMLYERVGTNVRVVRAGVRAVSKEPGAEVLQSVMREQVALCEQAGGGREDAQSPERVAEQRGWHGSGSRIYTQDVVTSGVSGIGVREDANAESDVHSWSGREAEGDAGRSGRNVRTPEWWKWTRSLRGAADVARAFGRGLVRGAPGWHREGVPREGFAHKLQDRPGSSAPEDRRRVRRHESQNPGGVREGRTEDCILGVSGLDDLAILEPRDRERYERVRRGSVRSDAVTVYNIETASSNYFAESILVHNCHAIANRNSRGRRTLVTFKSSEGELPMMKIAMSATWAGNSFDNAWSTTRWLWPDLIEPYWTWRELWCSESPVTKADGKPLYVDGKLKVTVTGEKDPEGSFVKTLPCYIRHESEERAPELIEILVDSTPEQRQQYSDLKTDLLTWAQTWTGERVPLMVDIPGALYSRLRQVSLAQLSIEPGNGDDIPDRVYFADDAPSGKLRALKGVLNGWGDQPVLLFTDSKLFAKLTAKRMTEAGYKAEAWTGDTSAKEQERIKSGFGREFKYLVATVQAAGTGLDGLQHVCSKILWLSMPPGNSLLREQGEGRIFRPGMTEEFGEFEQVTLLMRDSLDVEVLEDLVSNALHMRSSLTLAS